jgi:hypothetical protein
VDHQPLGQVAAISRLINSEASGENGAHVIPTEKWISLRLPNVGDRVLGFERDELHSPAVHVEHLRTASDVVRLTLISAKRVCEPDICCICRHAFDRCQLPRNTSRLYIQRNCKTPCDRSLIGEVECSIINYLRRDVVLRPKPL